MEVWINIGPRDRKELSSNWNCQDWTFDLVSGGVDDVFQDLRLGDGRDGNAFYWGRNTEEKSVFLGVDLMEENEQFNLQSQRYETSLQVRMYRNLLDVQI